MVQKEGESGGEYSREDCGSPQESYCSIVWVFVHFLLSVLQHFSEVNLLLWSSFEKIQPWWFILLPRKSYRFHPHPRVLSLRQRQNCRTSVAGFWPRSHQIMKPSQSLVLTQTPLASLSNDKNRKERRLPGGLGQLVSHSTYLHLISGS